MPENEVRALAFFSLVLRDRQPYLGQPHFQRIAAYSARVDRIPRLRRSPCRRGILESDASFAPAAISSASGPCIWTISRSRSAQA